MKENEKQKFCYGLVKVGSKGQIVIPSSARKTFGIKEGTELLILGDIKTGLAIIRPELTNEVLDSILKKGDEIC